MLCLCSVTGALIVKFTYSFICNILYHGESYPERSHSDGVTSMITSVLANAGFEFLYDSDNAFG